MVNVAEILKNVNIGFELYSPLYGNVIYEGITNNEKICVKIKYKNGNNSFEYFDKYGCKNYDICNCECLLFPSSENRSWDNFQIINMHSPVICSNDGFNWVIRTYLYGHECYLNNPDYPEKYKYICEVNKFDFNNYCSSENKYNSI